MSTVHVGHPIQEGVRDALRPFCGTPLRINVAPQSPLGPRALRIALEDQDAAPSPEELEYWLAEQEWTEAVAARGLNLYVAPTVEAMLRWLPAAPTTGLSASPHRFTDGPFESGPSSPKASLDSLRQYFLLEAVSHLAKVHPDNASVADADPHTVLERRCGVGRVYFSYDALRARYGGSVTPTDLYQYAHDLISRVPPVPGIGHLESHLHAEAIIALVLLKPKRTAQICIDRATIREGLDLLVAVIGACRGEPTLGIPSAAKKGGIKQCHVALRQLLMSFDVVPALLSAALVAAEPGLVLRHILQCAALLETVSAYFPAQDSLPALARWSIGQLLPAAIPVPGLLSRQKSTPVLELARVTTN